MNQTTIAILAGAAIIAGAVLYTNGAFRSGETKYPFTNAMKAKMSDPDSAQFRSVVEDRKLGDLIKNRMYCGEVNAKNRMGGYAGWQRFITIDPHGTGDWQITLESDVAGNFPVWCSE